MNLRCGQFVSSSFSSVICHAPSTASPCKITCNFLLAARCGNTLHFRALSSKAYVKLATCNLHSLLSLFSFAAVQPLPFFFPSPQSFSLCLHVIHCLGTFQPPSRQSFVVLLSSIANRQTLRNLSHHTKHLISALDQSLSAKFLSLTRFLPRRPRCPRANLYQLLYFGSGLAYPLFPRFRRQELDRPSHRADTVTHSHFASRAPSPSVDLPLPFD